MQPIIAILLAAIMLKEKLSERFWLWSIIAIVSAYFVSFGATFAFSSLQGAAVLPVIYALGQANSTDRENMIKIIKDDNFSVEDFTALVGMLERYGGTEYTEKMAGAYIQAAKDSLSIFNPSQSKEIIFHF